MTHTLFPDDDAPSRSPEYQEILRRLAVIEHNQRDMLFLLRSMRHAFRSERQKLSVETKRIHRAVLRTEPYNGRCPCCLETPVVDETGNLIPPAEYDHFWGMAYSAPAHSWLICRPCHQALTQDSHFAWYQQLRAQFRRYQAAVLAYTSAFGHRTPARLYSHPRRL